MSEYKCEYKYEFYDSEKDDIQSCQSCGCEAPVHKFSDKRFLCEICSMSFIGNATEYPEQYQPNALYVVIAQVGNIILDKTTDRLKLKENMIEEETND